MPNAKIDFDAHRKLSDKFALKLFFSLIWREVLLQYLPMCAVVLLSLFFIKGLEPDQRLVLVLILGFSTYVLSILLTNQYIINSLSRIKYKDFAVYLVKNNHILNKMEFYDCLCWRGSLLLREFALGVVYAVIAMNVEYFQLLSESVITHIDRGVQIGILMGAFVWILKTKKTGRLILMQPLK